MGCNIEHAVHVAAGIRMQAGGLNQEGGSPHRLNFNLIYFVGQLKVQLLVATTC